MSIFLRKSFRLAPGVRLNLSTSGVGLSAGARGARVGIGPRGGYVAGGRHGVLLPEIDQRITPRLVVKAMVRLNS